MIHLISGSKKTNLLFMPASLVSVDQSKLDPTPQHQSEYPSPAVHSDQRPTFPTVTESDQPTDYQHIQPTNYPPGTQPGPHQDYQHIQPANYPPGTQPGPHQDYQHIQPANYPPGTQPGPHQDHQHNQPTNYPPGTQPGPHQDHPPAVSQPSAGPAHTHFTVAPPDQACYPDLEIGSVVEVITTTAVPRYGVIKWIGRLPNVNYDIAGIELVGQCTGSRIPVISSTCTSFADIIAGRGTGGMH